MPRTRPPKPSTGGLQPEHSPTSTKSPAGLAAEFEKVTGDVVAEELVLNYEPVIYTSPMAARSRPRNGAVKEDPDEELSMWNQIKKDLEKCSVIQKRSKEVSEKIVAMEEKMGKCMFMRSNRKVLVGMILASCYSRCCVFPFKYATLEFQRHHCSVNLCACLAPCFKSL